eukprot:11492644-Prorocentrum_lima.AAC.1
MQSVYPSSGRWKRHIYAAPPNNVWRHFREMNAKGVVVPLGAELLYALEMLKPMYGLVGALLFGN